MAEELALEEGLRDGGAVDGDERPLPAPPRLVDDPRGQLLARAALAGDEDRGVGVADLLDQGPDAADRRRLAHERAVPRRSAGEDRDLRWPVAPFPRRR